MISTASLYSSALTAIDRADRAAIGGASNRAALRAMVAAAYGPKSAQSGLTSTAEGRLRPVAYRVLAGMMRTGASEDTVRRSVDNLESRGLVARANRTRDGWVYAVDLAAVLQLAAAATDAAVRPSERARRAARKAQQNAQLAAALTRLKSAPDAAQERVDCEIQTPHFAGYREPSEKNKERTTTERASARDQVVDLELDADPRDQVVEAALDADPRDQVVDRDQVAERPRLTLHTQGRPAKPAEPQKQQQNKAPPALALKGCESTVVDSLVTRWGAERVGQAIAEIDRRRAAGQTVNNPGGYLRALCESGSDLSQRGVGVGVQSAKEAERLRRQKADAAVAKLAHEREDVRLSDAAETELKRRNPDYAAKLGDVWALAELNPAEYREAMAERQRLTELYAPEKEAILAELRDGRRLAVLGPTGPDPGELLRAGGGWVAHG